MIYIVSDVLVKILLNFYEIEGFWNWKEFLIKFLIVCWLVLSKISD